MAKLFDFLVFDRAVDGPGTFYSDPGFNNVLCQAERLVISAVASNVAGTAPTLTIGVEGSPDQANWTAIDAGAPPLKDSPLDPAAPASTPRVFAQDQPAFTRLKVTLAGVGAKARIQVHVTGRD